MQYQVPAAGSTVLAATAVSGSLPVTGGESGLLVGIAVACLAIGSVTMRAAAAMKTDQQ